MTQNFPTRWAPTSYKWPYKWVTGVITLLIGVITPFITGRGPTLHGDFGIFRNNSVAWGSLDLKFSTIEVRELHRETTQRLATCACNVRGETFEKYGPLLGYPWYLVNGL